MKRALKITMAVALLLISAVIMSGCATTDHKTMDGSMMESKDTMHKPMSDSMAAPHDDMMGKSVKDSGMTETMK